MENRLKAMFDFQRFEPSDKLAAVIADTQSRMSRALSDDDLDFVSAAGPAQDDEQIIDKDDDPVRPPRIRPQVIK